MVSWIFDRFNQRRIKNTVPSISLYFGEYGAYPGETSTNPSRSLVCACF